MRGQQILIMAIACAILFQQVCAHLDDLDGVEVHVGLIVNMKSWEGKIAKSSIDMAISNFYAFYGHYTTRLILHTKNFKGEPLRALFAALDLLGGFKVEVIVHPQSELEAKFLTETGERERNIPMISFFHPNQLSKMRPFFVQITRDEVIQVEGIIAMIGAFIWRDVVLIYDNSNYQTEVMPHLMDLLRKKNINIAYEKVFFLNSTSDERSIVEELKKMKNLQSKLFIVHLSHLFLSPLFLNAAKLGMMSEGHVWILTTKSTNGLDSLDSSVIESMQGVVGFKNYVPHSWKLRHFTSRMKMKLSIEDPDEKVIDPLIRSFGIWAYDGIWFLSKAVERAKVEVLLERKQMARLNVLKSKNSPKVEHSGFGPILFKKLRKTKFSGLSGGMTFHRDGKMMPNAVEIVNVKGNEVKRVGFWSSRNEDKTSMERSTKRRRLHRSSYNDLEAIGGSSTIPESSFVKKKTIKLRIGVPLNGFRKLVNVETENNKTKVTGFCIDVFREAVALLPNYEIDYEFIPFINSSGKMRGTYNELVYQVYLQKFDAVVGDVTITANRSRYVDFTIPFTDIGVGIATLDNAKNTWLFLKPLSTNLWIASICFFIFTGFVVWVIEHPINHEFQGSPHQQIGTMLWFAFSTLVYAHREKLATNLSKFVVIIWLFLVFILNSSYTATLASMMTVKQLQLDPKQSNIGHQTSDSPLEGIIRNSKYRDFTMKSYYSPQDYADALSIGSKNGGVSAILDEIPYIKIFLAQYSNQNFYLVGTMSTTNGFGFVFPKGSPLVSEMSWAIAKLREEKKLKMLEGMWFDNQDKSTLMDDSSSIDHNPNALTLDNFAGLFIISGASSSLAILIFLHLHMRNRYLAIKEFIALYSRKTMESTRTYFHQLRNVVLNMYA